MTSKVSVSTTLAYRQILVTKHMHDSYTVILKKCNQELLPLKLHEAEAVYKVVNRLFFVSKNSLKMKSWSILTSRGQFHLLRVFWFPCHRVRRHWQLLFLLPRSQGRWGTRTKWSSLRSCGQAYRWASGAAFLQVRSSPSTFSWDQQSPSQRPYEMLLWQLS